MALISANTYKDITQERAAVAHDLFSIIYGTELSSSNAAMCATMGIIEESESVMIEITYLKRFFIFSILTNYKIVGSLFFLWSPILLTPRIFDRVDWFLPTSNVRAFTKSEVRVKLFTPL